MYKNNLILTSNGYNNNGKRSEQIENLFKTISKDKDILLIGNAAKKSNVNSRVDVKVNFENIGAKKVELVDLNANNLSVIFDYDIIYVIGGDIGELIELNSTTEFKKYILSFLKQGIYIGESAGAMITGRDCKWVYDIKKGTKPKYDREFKSYTGLGLTDLIIFPHYDEAGKEERIKIEKYEIENNVNIIRLDNGDFIELKIEK